MISSSNSPSADERRIFVETLPHVKRDFQISEVVTIGRPLFFFSFTIYDLWSTKPPLTSIHFRLVKIALGDSRNFIETHLQKIKKLLRSSLTFNENLSEDTCARSSKKKSFEALKNFLAVGQKFPRGFEGRKPSPNRLICYRLARRRYFLPQSRDQRSPS